VKEFSKLMRPGGGFEMSLMGVLAYKSNKWKKELSSLSLKNIAKLLKKFGMLDSKSIDNPHGNKLCYIQR
jgi:hypothetical protein